MVIQNLAVLAAYSETKEFNTLPTVSHKSCAARFTLITEYGLGFIGSLVSLLTYFKPPSKSS